MLFASQQIIQRAEGGDWLFRIRTVKSNSAKTTVNDYKHSVGTILGCAQL